MWQANVVMVVGAPASGKTTLTKVLSGMLETYDAYLAVPKQTRHHTLAS